MSALGKNRDKGIRMNGQRAEVVALGNGVTREELTEMITPLAFYAGWPSAATAVGIARKVFAEAEAG